MPNARQKLFLEGPIGTALTRLAIPIMLGNLLQTGYQLTDAFWVGRLGAAAVAAVSVSFPVTFLVIALGAGLAIAGATLSAQYMGAGRQDMVNHVAAQTMLMVAITSAVLGAAGYVLAPYLLDLLGVASAAPITPCGGSGPKPKMNSGSNRKFNSTVPSTIRSGILVSPTPRISA